jgi:uncharacterized protein (TIGR03437 family)
MSKVWMRVSLVVLSCGASSAQTSATPAPILTTFAGTDWIFPNHVAALNAPFPQITTITLDPAGNLVVAQPIDCMVSRIRPDQTVEVIAGNGICATTYLNSGDGGPATAAGLYQPWGLAYDPKGNLYIANTSHVRKVAPDGTISLFAGDPNGGLGFSGDGGPATSALLDTHWGYGIVSDQAGNIYITDSFNNRIRKVALDGTISTIAGNGQQGFSGDGGPALKAAFYYPTGLTFDKAGNLFVADTANGRVRKIGTDGVITTVASNLYADTLAFDSAGTMYIGGDGIIYKLAAGATTPTVIAGNGTVGFSGDGGPAAKALLGGAQSVAVDAAGNIYTSDLLNARVRKIDPQGIITTIAGNGKNRYAGENAPALSSFFMIPWGLAINGTTGEVYVSDEQADDVVKIGRASDGVLRVTTVAGTGKVGYSGDGGPAIQATFSTPHALTVDPKGNLYIADLGNKVIRKVTPQGIISTYAALFDQQGYGSEAGGLVFDQAGNLYATCPNEHLVRKVDPSGKITIFAGTGVSGYSGDGGPALKAQLASPGGIAVDASGSIYVSDGQAAVVRKIAPDGIITTYAGNGQPGIGGDGKLATEANLAEASGIAFNSAGDLYVVQHYFGIIRKIDGRTHLISTVAGTGNKPQQIGDGQPANLVDLAYPVDAATDPAGNLYFTDQWFDRVRVMLAAPAQIAISPASQLALPDAAKGGAPVTQTFAVTGSVGGLPFAVTVNTGGSGNWLTTDAGVAATPRLVTLTADPTGLAPKTYSATVTIVPAAAIPSALTLNVSWTVGPAQDPQLATDHQSFSFTISKSAPQGTQALQISNTGGQSLNYAAVAATASGGNWLSLSAASGQAAPGKPSTVNIVVSAAALPPGTYLGSVTIQSNGGQQTIPVIMTVSDIAQAVLLTQTGLSYTAVEKGGVIPPQTFGVINAGAGLMQWTASATTTSGGSWLQISPASGITDAAGAAPQVTVSVNPAGLAAGNYYGLVRVSAPATANGVGFVTVFLKVLPLGSTPAAAVQPAELVFHALPSGELPGAQQFSVYNIGAQPRTFTAAIAGAFTSIVWPLTGTLDPAQPKTIVVQPYQNLPVGTYPGQVTFQLSDGTVQTAKVTLISAAAAAAHSRAGSSEPRDSGPCAPTGIQLALSSLSQSFSVAAGWPVGLSVKATDDCNNPIVSGTGAVWVEFSNGDNSLPLTALNDGTWQGTWNTHNVNPNVAITIWAKSLTLPQAKTVVSGAMTAQDEQPVIAYADILNGFTADKTIRPLAPGTFIAIYTASSAPLADFSDSAPAGQPLPVTLGNASVHFDDRLAPLYSANPNQINVKVPWAAINTTSSVYVQRGNALSSIVKVDIAPAQPTILQYADGSAYAADTPADKSTGYVVSQKAFAHRGDTLVFYCTGLGLVTPQPGDSAISPANPLAQTSADVMVSFGATSVKAPFAGLTPGFIGLYQVNVVIPPDAPLDDKVPVKFTVAGQDSPTVTLPIH